MDAYGRNEGKNQGYGAAVHETECRREEEEEVSEWTRGVLGVDG